MIHKFSSSFNNVKVTLRSSHPLSLFMQKLLWIFYRKKKKKTFSDAFMHVFTKMDEMLKYASTFMVKVADLVQGHTSIHCLNCVVIYVITQAGGQCWFCRPKAQARRSV